MFRAVAFDARMRDFSGIGTYIRGLLTALGQAEQSPKIIREDSAPRIYSLREQWEIPRRFKETSAALLHVPHYNVPAIMASRCIVTVHDLIHLKFPQFLPSPLARAYAAFFLRFVVPRARSILTVSEFTKQDMVRTLGLRPERITVTPLGAPDVRPPAPDDAAFLAQAGLSEGFFLYIGNLKPFKNIPRLVRVYSAWAKAHFGSPPLVLVGRNFLPHLQPDLKSGPNVRWLGEVPVERLSALYRSARALLFPSLYEGFGLPPLEAMAHGTPVLCSNRASLPEVAGDAALQVDPEDDSALAQGIDRLANDASLRNELSERGRVRARLFTWERTARLTREAYERCL